VVLRDRLQATAGVIVVDRRGEPGVAFTTPQMAWAIGRAGTGSSGAGIGVRSGH
jgi:hypothetical protein